MLNANETKLVIFTHSCCWSTVISITKYNCVILWLQRWEFCLQIYLIDMKWPQKVDQQLPWWSNITSDKIATCCARCFDNFKLTQLWARTRTCSYPLNPGILDQEGSAQCLNASPDGDKPQEMLTTLLRSLWPYEIWLNLWLKHVWPELAVSGSDDDDPCLPWWEFSQHPDMLV